MGGFVVAGVYTHGVEQRMKVIVIVTGIRSDNKDTETLSKRGSIVQKIVLCKRRLPHYT